MLYDREKDPAENKNIVDLEERKDIIKKFGSILSESNKQAQ